MGVFFTRQQNLATVAQQLLRTAHAAQPSADPGANATADTDTIVNAARPTFSVNRALIALGLVILLFVLYAVSAHDTKMAAHSDALFHLFEVVASGLTALLVGEAASSG
jgi:hypothetical protein